MIAGQIRYTQVSFAMLKQGQDQDQDRPAGDLRQHLAAELADIAAEEAEEAANSDTAWPTALSPTTLTALPRTAEQTRWLQVTEWPRFLAGHRLDAAARLLDLPYRPTLQQRQKQRQRQHHEARPGLHQPPHPRDSSEIGTGTGTGTDLVLCNLLDAFDRIIGHTREALAAGKLNVFDQHRLNSFIPRRPSPKPLYQLQQGTYDKYQHVFRRLICFVYRLAWAKPLSAPRLHYRLTDEQALALTDAVRAAQELADAGEEDKQEDPGGGDTKGRGEGYLVVLQKGVDNACVILCISLLDHRLYGDVFDSVVVRFLAVLAIEESADSRPLPRPRLSEAVRYTSHLSALIKAAQLLVAARALLAVERDEHDYPALALEAMQEQFMVDGTRSPICWANKVRAYGKAIRDTMTSLGHIGWSDDGEILSYKAIQGHTLRDVAAPGPRGRAGHRRPGRPRRAPPRTRRRGAR